MITDMYIYNIIYSRGDIRSYPAHHHSAREILYSNTYLHILFFVNVKSILFIFYVFYHLE